MLSNIGHRIVDPEMIKLVIETGKKLMSELNISRRHRLDLFTPAELAIHNAMLEVEKAGASIELTNAVIKLMEARNLVADHVDAKLKAIDSVERVKQSDVILSLERTTATPHKVTIQKVKYTDDQA